MQQGENNNQHTKKTASTKYFREAPVKAKEGNQLKSGAYTQGTKGGSKHYYSSAGK